jgi:LEA14-like dessication related protein
MKKLIFTIVTLYVLLTLTTCQTLMLALQDPVVSLHSAELTNINFSGAQLLCKVQVQNPNPFDIPFPETDWELFINANSFVRGTVKNNQRIRARNTAIVEVPVNLDYVELINTFRSLRGTRQTNYRAALNVKIPLPVLGDKSWRLEHSGTIPLPQLPRVSAPSMRIESSNTSRSEILVTMNVENPNPFQVPLPIITYDYQLNRNSFIRGNVNNTGFLAPSSTTPVSFRLTVNYSDLFRSFASLINAREVSSLLLISCDFGIPVFSGEPMNFQVAGTLPIVR